jgi:hypothetical protein
VEYSQLFLILYARFLKFKISKMIEPLLLDGDRWLLGLVSQFRNQQEGAIFFYIHFFKSTYILKFEALQIFKDDKADDLGSDVGFSLRIPNRGPNATTATN